MGSSNEPPLPIIDLEAFTSASDTETRLEAGKQLVSACHDVGFVYIKNHGVPESELSRAFDVSKKWFDLPTDQKMKAPHPPGWAVHRGYSWPGLEKVSNLVSGPAADGGSDDEFIEKLRQVQDFKVWQYPFMTKGMVTGRSLVPFSASTYSSPLEKGKLRSRLRPEP